MRPSYTTAAYHSFIYLTSLFKITYILLKVLYILLNILYILLKILYILLEILYILLKILYILLTFPASTAAATIARTPSLNPKP